MTSKCLLAIAWATCLAPQLATAAPNVTFSPDKRLVYAQPAQQHAQPRKTAPVAGKVIFDNLARLDPYGVYMVGTGFSFGGPNSPIGLADFAAAFTPAQDATVTQVQAGANYISGVKTKAELTIYADAAGAPGAILWQGRGDMPVFGDCCAVVSVPVKPNTLQLKGGTQYWLGVGATAAGTDTFGAWVFNVADFVDVGVTAVNTGSGWMVSPSSPNVAFAIFGK